MPVLVVHRPMGDTTLCQILNAFLLKLEAVSFAWVHVTLELEAHILRRRTLWRQVICAAQDDQDGIKNDQALRMARELMPKLASLQAAMASLHAVSNDFYEGIRKYPCPVAGVRKVSSSQLFAGAGIGHMGRHMRVLCAWSLKVSESCSARSSC